MIYVVILKSIAECGIAWLPNSLSQFNLNTTKAFQILNTTCFFFGVTICYCLEKFSSNINITNTMLPTKNEQSIFESLQVYWKYYSKYASLLDILLVLAVFLVNLHTLSSISSKVAYFLKHFVHFS